MNNEQVIKNNIVIACIFFACGFGWGQWFAEKAIRKERSSMEQGRLLVSVPMHKDEAAKVFEAIQTIVELSEGRRDE